MNRIAFRYFIFGGFCSLILTSGIQAGVILRPLPITNLNESAGADRSNNSFTQTDPSERMIGDFFIMPPGTSGWRIDSITVWSVGSNLDEAIGTEFPSISLYGGVRSLGDFGVRSTGTPNTTFELDGTTVLSSNPNITHTRVQYANGEDYEGVGTLGADPRIFYPIWRTTFSNLDWMVPGGALIDFGAWAPDSDPFSLYGNWFTHVSNAFAGGIFQEGADGAFLVFDFANLSNEPFRANPFELGLWDKTADVNVIVVTTELPEPGYGGAVLASLGILGWFRRRKR